MSFDLVFDAFLYFSFYFETKKTSKLCTTHYVCFLLYIYIYIFQRFCDFRMRLLYVRMLWKYVKIISFNLKTDQYSLIVLYFEGKKSCTLTRLGIWPSFITYHLWRFLGISLIHPKPLELQHYQCSIFKYMSLKSKVWLEMGQSTTREKARYKHNSLVD